MGDPRESTGAGCIRRNSRKSAFGPTSREEGRALSCPTTRKRRLRSPIALAVAVPVLGSSVAPQASQPVLGAPEYRRSGGEEPAAVIEPTTALVASAAGRLKVPAAVIRVVGKGLVDQPFVPHGTVWAKMYSPTLEQGLSAYLLPDGTIIDEVGFREKISAWGRANGPVPPEVRATLNGMDAGQQRTFVISMPGPDLNDIVAKAQESYPTANLAGGVPDTGDPKLNQEIQTLIERQYESAIGQITSEIASRARILGLEVDTISTDSPMIWVTGIAKQIDEMAAQPGVLRVDESGTTSPALSEAGPTDQANWSYGQGYTGAGARIGVVEYSNVDWSATDIAAVPAARHVSYSTTGINNYSVSHPTWVMGAIASQTAGRKGIAPGAFYVDSSTGGYSPNNSDAAVITAAAKAINSSYGNADVLNFSLVQDTTQGEAALQAWLDNEVNVYHIHGAAAAGNQAQNHCPDLVVPSPASAWNVLGVGGIDDAGTTTWADDSIWTGGCYIDPPANPGESFGHFKPDISAPAVCVTVNGSACSSSTGTSIASPQVAGAFGLLVGQNLAELQYFPETTRAILMASSYAHRLSPDPSGLDDREGLGSLSTKWANLFAARATSGGYPLGDHGHWIATASGSPGAYQEPASTFINVATGGGRKVRFDISWDSHGYSSGYTSFSDLRLSDIDVIVRDPGGNIVGSSLSASTNVEHVEWVANAGTNYSVEIRPYSWDPSLASERIGWAWVAFSTP